MKRLNQSGSHLIAIAVGVLVLGVVSFAGYTVMQKSSTTTDSSTPVVQVKKANAIKSTADLDKAAKTLDTSSTQVDSGLNDSSLDADLNDML